jgi:hypothetical protein
MSTLSDARDELKELLAAATGKAAFSYLPGALQPPAWVVNNSSTYVTSGGSFGSILVHLDACYFTRSAANTVMTSDVDDVLEDALVALIEAGWNVESATVEGLTANSATYLGGVITVTKTFKL